VSTSSPAPGGRLRVGVAGLGAVAQAVHLPLLARLPDRFRIAAVCDLSASLRDVIGDRYAVPDDTRFGTVDEMLDAADLDGLILLTSGSHGPAALSALDRGVPILCEKPLAFTVAEADRLAASPSADRLLLGYMKVFDPAVEEAARIVGDPSSGLGDPRAIEVAVLHPTSAAQLAFARLAPPPADVPREAVAALRAESNAPITVGQAAIKWSHAFTRVGLDYYDMHYYGWVDQYFPIGGKSLADYGIGDKPVVVGEFPLQGWTNPNGTLTANQIMNKLWDQGYAGAKGWAFTQDGMWATNKGNIATFATAKGCAVRY